VADTDTLTAHDIASEATWADKYRDSDRDTTKIRYKATGQWHFVDVELAQPDLASACFGHPPLPPGIPASKGPPQACVVDKINQFATELGDPATGASEQLLALKFLLHFVGDLHQPSTHPTTTMPAGIRSSFRAKDCTRATFITIGTSSSWRAWELTRAKLRPP
jgi:hypothetical protein